MMFVIMLVSFAVLFPAVQAQTQEIYELTWLENVTAADMNEAGVIVGYSGSSADAIAIRSFKNQYGNWVTEDLNGLTNEWIDLDPNSGEPPSGWIAGKALGINSSGQIVGAASHVDHPSRVFVLSFPINSSPEFTLLPRFGSDNNQGTAINDDGVVVGKANSGAIVFTPWTEPAFEPQFIEIPAYRVDINNKGVFVTFSGNFNSPIEAFRVTPIDLGNGTYSYAIATVDPFPNVHFHGINEDGAISGRRETLGKGKHKDPGGPIRIDRFDVEIILQESHSGGSQARDINNDGDVCYSVSGTPWVYFANANESFSLDGQILNPDETWLNSSIYSQAINDSGQIAGYASGGPAFILTPIDLGPTLSVNDLTINEGNTGTITEAYFTITLSEPMEVDVTVPYVIGGSATEGEDYSMFDDTAVELTIVAGQTSTTVAFIVYGDAVAESDESIVIQLLGAPDGVMITTSEGTATIKNYKKKGGRKK